MDFTGQNGCHRDCSSWAPPPYTTGSGDKYVLQTLDLKRLQHGWSNQLTDFVRISEMYCLLSALYCPHHGVEFCIKLLSPGHIDPCLLNHIHTKHECFPVLQIFVEAKRTSPSILYIPHIGQWWETVGPALRATFLSLLSSIPAFAPILLLATCSLRYDQLSMEV